MDFPKDRADILRQESQEVAEHMIIALGVVRDEIERQWGEGPPLARLDFTPFTNLFPGGMEVFTEQLKLWLEADYRSVDVFFGRDEGTAAELLYAKRI